MTKKQRSYRKQTPSLYALVNNSEQIHPVYWIKLGSCRGEKKVCDCVMEDCLITHMCKGGWIKATGSLCFGISSLESTQFCNVDKFKVVLCVTKNRNSNYAASCCHPCDSPTEFRLLDLPHKPLLFELTQLLIAVVGSHHLCGPIRGWWDMHRASSFQIFADSRGRVRLGEVGSCSRLWREMCTVVVKGLFPIPSLALILLSCSHHWDSVLFLTPGSLTKLQSPFPVSTQSLFPFPSSPRSLFKSIVFPLFRSSCLCIVPLCSHAALPPHCQGTSRGISERIEEASSLFWLQHLAPPCPRAAENCKYRKKNLGLLIWSWGGVCSASL